ncbi:MAG: SDR family oxidoreductase [Nakamurella sp.]
MELGLRGRTAVVCASTAGLGRATAEALAAEGVRVVISGRRADVASNIAVSLPGAEAVQCDITEPGAARRLVAEATQKLGAPLDIAVLNGPGPKPGSAVDVSSSDLRAAIESLLVFQQELVAEVLPGMRERSWGRIVAIGSTSVVEPIAGLALSSIGRSALAAYLKTLAGEVAADGVTVNMVLPGRIDTDRVRQLDAAAADSDPGAAARQAASIPAARYGAVEEFGAVAAFLCGQPASYVTGSTIRVDGGLVHRL